MDNGKKILITGATGFIGRNLKEFLQDRYELYVPTHRELDLLDANQVKEYFMNQRIDIVIHSATQNTLQSNHIYESEMLERNLRMFINLERCNEYYGKLFFLGSGAEYGKQQELKLVSEDHFDKIVPSDQYGLSKYIMTKLLRQHSNIYNLRLFGVYGQYENYNVRFISNAIWTALHHKKIIIRQNVKFDYLYIDDLCKIIEYAIKNGFKHREYNVCQGTGIELIEIAQIIAQKIENVTIQVTKKGLNKEYTGDNKKLINEIGNFKFTRIENAIEKMIVYFKEAEEKNG